jgi:hypothetical protein
MEKSISTRLAECADRRLDLDREIEKSRRMLECMEVQSKFLARKHARLLEEFQKENGGNKCEIISLYHHG